MGGLPKEMAPPAARGMLPAMQVKRELGLEVQLWVLGVRKESSSESEWGMKIGLLSAAVRWV
jgi:hypothetical protein